MFAHRHIARRKYSQLTLPQYPRFHPDPPPPLRGFLLSQKHRRSSPGWSPLVERGECHIWRLAHGL